ncbi:hypothetical protein HF086_010335 [Spodoptera exigua]|uniref:Uncharacterized protein n=1 Tax=Spodoptera exigua TaxID=7107 RepID=A0A922M1K2_SPOEX|nr:hypothetical protein HF086_010335 [Spodoptera exigua]
MTLCCNSTITQELTCPNQMFRFCSDHFVDGFCGVCTRYIGLTVLTLLHDEARVLVIITIK